MGSATVGIQFSGGFRSVLRRLFCSPTTPFTTAIVQTDTSDDFEELKIDSCWFGSAGILSAGVTKDTPIGLNIYFGNAVEVANCWFSGLQVGIKLGNIVDNKAVTGVDIHGCGFEAFNGTEVGYGGGDSAIGVCAEEAQALSIAGCIFQYAADQKVGSAGQRPIVLKYVLGGSIRANLLNQDGVATAAISVAHARCLGVEISGNAFYRTNTVGIEFVNGGVPDAVEIGENFQWNNSVPIYDNTFTPGLTFGGGSTSMTFSARTGTWRRIGKFIHVQGMILLSAKGTSMGVARLTGLPVSSLSANNTDAPVTVHANDLQNITGHLSALVLAGDTQIAPYYLGTGGVMPLDDTHFKDNTEFHFSVVYEGQRWHPAF
jgi:hypothetical protein